MSSYELLELCEFMPDAGAFKTGLRGGDPPERDLALYQIANELAVLRMAQVQGIKSEDIGSRLFMPPSRTKQLAEETEYEKEQMTILYSIADRSKG